MSHDDPSIVVVLGSGPGPSTVLDEALGRRLRDQLRTHGVAFVSAARLRRAGADLAAAVRDEHAVTRAAGGRCRTLLVTDETEADVARSLGEIASLSQRPALDVRLLVERQDRLAEHALMAGIRTGAPVQDGAGLDLCATVRRVSELPFVAAVTPRPYELVHGGVPTWVDDLLDVVGLRGRLDLRPLVEGEPIATHRAISARGLQVGRALLPELTTAAERELLHGFLLGAYPAGSERLSDAAERAAIVARHRRDNHDFFARHLPDLPPDSYGDDEATALLAQVPVTVRLPRPAPTLVARRGLGTLRRGLVRRVRRGARRGGAGS